VNAVARTQVKSGELVPNVPVVEGATLLAVISRAAADPNTDVEKMERLMALYERIEAKNAERAFNDSMNAAQAEMRPISADAENPQTHSKYATFAKLDKALRPIYTARLLAELRRGRLSEGRACSRALLLLAQRWAHAHVPPRHAR
jgi:hypothetical protein